MSDLLSPDHIESIVVSVPDESWKEIIELQHSVWSKVAQLVGYRNLRHVVNAGKRIGIDWETAKISAADCRSDMCPITDIHFWNALLDIKVNKGEGDNESRKLDLDEYDDNLPF